MLSYGLTGVEGEETGEGDCADDDADDDEDECSCCN